jgi:hypothetical protein
VLIGNGASIAVSSRYSYGSLYEKAKSLQLLDEATAQVFDDFSSTDFEAVLRYFASASRVLAAYRYKHTNKARRILARRANVVRKALDEVIRQVHVAWTELEGSVLTSLFDALHSHSTVFTLNYDLMNYWALMNDAGRFKDLLLNSRFKPKEAYRLLDELPDRLTLFYLHGGLHLYTDEEGVVRKRNSSIEDGLLKLLRRLDVSKESPLIVAGATGQEKLATIQASPYLQFAFEQLRRHPKPLVVVGASLNSESDSHVLHALQIQVKNLRSSGDCKIAVGIYKGTLSDAAVRAQKARLQLDLKCDSVAFFDSSTHPLCDPGNCVDVEE